VIRVAFTLIGGTIWTGGYNYLVNLMRALSEHASWRVQSVLYVGDDVAEERLAPFKALSGTKLVCNSHFDEVLTPQRLREAVLTGSDRSAVRAFQAHVVHVVFEAARFYGWRLRIPAIA